MISTDNNTILYADIVTARSLGRCANDFWRLLPNCSVRLFPREGDEW